MKITVIGAHGKIGRSLVPVLKSRGHDVQAVVRADLDLLNLPQHCPLAMQGNVVYICAAMTRFIDCEANPDAYRVNVDAPAHIARWFPRTVYLSSEAVERALHTNYGMQKALAEMGVRREAAAVIARLGKVDDWSMSSVCHFLAGLADAPPGIYRWQADATEQPVPAPLRMVT